MLSGGVDVETKLSQRGTKRPRISSHHMSAALTLKIKLQAAEMVPKTDFKDETTKLCREFPSLSEYCGEWKKSWCEGLGEYTFPHGVKYIGKMKDSQFHGHGMLIYPNGQRLRGEWYDGELTAFALISKDGRQTDANCLFPERRFHREKHGGFPAKGKINLTSEGRASQLPFGCYDVGRGYYNPEMKCILDDTGLLRPPMAGEESWIKQHCRKWKQGPVGYKPQLHEFWSSGTKHSVKEIMEEIRKSDNITLGEE